MSSNESSRSSSSDSDSSKNSTMSSERRYKQRRQRNQIINQMILHVSQQHNPQELFQMATRVPRATRLYVNRDREDGHQRLWNDYFAPNPVFPPNLLQRRFRMRKDVFLRIVDVVSTNNPYFQQRADACGRLGASPLLKCTAAMRLLAYGTAADSVEDYLRVSGCLARESLHNFVEEVISNFSNEYLRRPTEQDLMRLLHAGEEQGFPGMMGSIDCMHWEWKNCPREWRGQYQGRGKKPTLILEAVASYDLWIWHAFFGTPGRCNDINVLDRSPVFNDIFEGRAPPVRYKVNGHEYDMGYYLTDGIYPKWAAFIQSIDLPRNDKQNLFKIKQESVRKDVERAFGVLQACFAIIRNQAMAQDEVLLGKIMIACTIIHNMIVEDERDTYGRYYDPAQYEPQESEIEPTKAEPSTSTGQR